MYVKNVNSRKHDRHKMSTFRGKISRKQKNHMLEMNRLAKLKHAENTSAHKLATQKNTSTCNTYNLLFTFSVLVTGGTFTTLSDFCTYMNFEYPKEDAFYKCQKKIAASIDKLLNKKMQKYQKEVIGRGKPFIACFDGGYSHRRNASECVMEIIHPEDKKIFAYCVTAKANGHRKDAEYTDSSKSLEIIALRKLLEEWCPKNVFCGYCHDLDSAARATIEKAGYNLTEYYDPNHSRNHFDTLLNSVSKKYKGALNGIKTKLRQHYQSCLGLKSAINMRDRWRKCVNHFLSEDSKWKNKNDQESIKALNEIVLRACFLFEHICVGVRTQLNECFHSMKCRFADKRHAFTNSWHTRVQMAILEFNWPGEWQLELASLLGLHLSKEHTERIINELNKRKTKRMLKRQDKYIIFEKERRVRRRIIRTTRDFNDDSYVFHDDIARKKAEESGKYEKKKSQCKLPYTDPDKPLPANYVFTTETPIFHTPKSPQKFTLKVEKIFPEIERLKYIPPFYESDGTDLTSDEYSETEDNDEEYKPIYTAEEEEEDYEAYKKAVLEDDQDIWRLDEEEDEYDINGNKVIPREEEEREEDEEEAEEEEVEEEEENEEDCV